MVSELAELAVKLRGGQNLVHPIPQMQNLKVQMEQLQWGFPIATPLSLNNPTSINRK